MLQSALTAKGTGYHGSPATASWPGTERCTAFDPFDILANPLGGDTAAARESRVFASKSGGAGTTYVSHEFYLMRRKDARPGDVAFYVAVHHGGGRQVWALSSCYHYSEETIAALLAMPERALYSLLHGIVAALDDTKRAAERDTADEWRRATVGKRVKVSRQPTKGRAFVWIEPERQEGESEAQHKLRCSLAKPSGVR
jgi:hypothetical protein